MDEFDTANCGRWDKSIMNTNSDYYSKFIWSNRNPQISFLN